MCCCPPIPFTTVKCVELAIDTASISLVFTSKDGLTSSSVGGRVIFVKYFDAVDLPDGAGRHVGVLRNVLWVNSSRLATVRRREPEEAL